MSVVSAAAFNAPASAHVSEQATRDATSFAGCAGTIGVAALVLVAPFESLHPVIRLPGQSLSTVEAVLLLVLGGCGIALARERAWTVLPAGDALSWTALVLAAAIAAAGAPIYSGNALRMAARLGAAAAIWGVVAVSARSASARHYLACAVLLSGVVVAGLVIADFAGIERATRFLAPFRTGIAVVGAQLRASGPFQYPTIASMYLEISFAIGLGLFVAAEQARLVVRLALVAVLAVVAQGVVLTFTRSGLITIGASLLLMWTVCRRRGWRRSTLLLGVLAAIVALEVVTSRSAEMLMLRLTSEGQGRWFSAVFDVPQAVALDTRFPIDVPVTVTNTGRATWSSEAAQPVALSYHWVAEDSDEVIAWEGVRTPFAEPVRPGGTVSLVARVGGPGRPGRFRLLWDIEQKGRLWFSTEPNAALQFSTGTLTGPETTAAFGTGPRRIPRMAVRPGRLVLWGAAWRMFRERPLLGVGPDNFRLLYGRYSAVKQADPRVHSNNMYVEVVAGMGLAGAVALGWLVWRAARAARGAAATSGVGVGIGGACLAIALHGLTDSFLSFTGTYILIAVILGLASACGSPDRCHAHRV